MTSNKIAKPIRLKPDVLALVMEEMEENEISFQRVIETIINNHYKKKLNKKESRTVKQLSAKTDHTEHEKLFMYWAKVFEKGAGYTLTADDKKKVDARLKEKFTPQQLQQAIFGLSLIRMRDNPGVALGDLMYTDFALIMRNAENVRKYAQGCKLYKRPGGEPIKTNELTWLDNNEADF